MSQKDKQIPRTVVLDTPADRAMQDAVREGERRQLEYVQTLHPRERAALAPWTLTGNCS